ncbi:MAG: hypothetical protein E7568_04730 [Ruminococcaceae bacterium]|nr:hypothetical protein [Oscillospiraceae bacterium]
MKIYKIKQIFREGTGEVTQRTVTCVTINFEFDDGDIHFGQKITTEIGLKLPGKQGLYAESSFAHNYIEKCGHDLIEESIKNIYQCEYTRKE